MTFLNQEPITAINVVEKSSMEVAQFVNHTILSHKLPQYTPNNPLTIHTDIMPLLSMFSNNQAYVNELYNIVYSAWFQQKIYKKEKHENWNESQQSELEAKKEILYRTWQTLSGMYEAASRLMTGIGEPDNRQSRHQ